MVELYLFGWLQPLLFAVTSEQSAIPLSRSLIQLHSQAQNARRFLLSLD